MRHFAAGPTLPADAVVAVKLFNVFGHAHRADFAAFVLLSV
jgi:hypothetical protein